MSNVGVQNRILIAGVGNVLRQDDAFGIEVVCELQKRGSLPANVKVIEIGIGGVSLVQELYDGYDALLLVDVVSRNGVPGQTYLLESEVADIDALPVDEKRDFLADMHYTNPTRALMLAKALHVLPKHVYILGCEPARYDDFEMSLSQEVQVAIPDAIRRIAEWVEEFSQTRVA